MTITSELKGHFLRLYQMALTDGDFSKTEWKMLYDMATERNISHEELDRILLSADGPIPIPNSIKTRIEYLIDFARLIWADGKVTEDEKDTLVKYAKKFEFEESKLKKLTDYILEKIKQGVSKEELMSELN